jgi:hypothetical protein
MGTIGNGQLIFVSLIFVVLLALTLRSVILRERAMIRHRHDDEHRSTYENRWRKPEAG